MKFSRILALMSIIAITSAKSLAQDCMVGSCPDGGVTSKEEFDRASNISLDDLRNEFGAQKLIFYYLESKTKKVHMLNADLISHRPILSWISMDLPNDCGYKFPYCPSKNYSTISFFESTMTALYYDPRHYSSEGFETATAWREWQLRFNEIARNCTRIRLKVKKGEALVLEGATGERPCNSPGLQFSDIQYMKYKFVYPAR